MKSTDSSSRPETATVLLAGFDAAIDVDLSDLDAEVLVVPSLAGALDLVGRRQIAVLCVGGRLRESSAANLLNAVRVRSRESGTVHVLLAAGSDLELFRDLIDGDEIYYLSQELPPAPAIQEILVSALERHRQRIRSRDGGQEDLASLHSVLELTRELSRAVASKDAAERVFLLTRRAIERLVTADGAECLLYDPHEEILWARRPDTGEVRTESAATGLVSYVVRTGAAVRLESVGDDPRYDPEADNNGGSPDQRFLAVPVIRGDRHRLAVLTALRRADRPPFSDLDRKNLELLAAQSAATLDRFVLQARVDELSMRHSALGTAAATVFRQEALEYHHRGFGDQGNVLELSPSWMPWAYRLLLVVFVAVVLYSVVGTVSEYATGLAVVRATDGSIGALDGDADLEVVALFPGHYRPLIRPGMSLHLELRGHGSADQVLVVEAIDERIVGPVEARRLLGSEIGDAIPVPGPVFFLRCGLPGPRFESGGEIYEIYRGMQGTAVIEIRHERILSAVIPGLKAFDREMS